MLIFFLAWLQEVVVNFFVCFFSLAEVFELLDEILVAVLILLRQRNDVA
jgi:hypothetical protein